MFQQFEQQNRIDKQFNEWSAKAKAQGYTDEQIAQLKQIQQQQQQQPTFWQDVGRGMGTGALAGEIGRASCRERV